MCVFAALCICLLTIICIYLRTLNSRYSYFKQRTIPSPPHQFFFGHLKKIWSVPLITHQLRSWTSEYGAIYGLFEGTKPVYVVSDVEFLQEVYIKQFSLFHSRRVPFIARKYIGNTVHLLAAEGAKWHRQRNIINPAFTSAKLKLMSSRVHECVDSLMNKIDGLCGQEINICLLYKRLTMDVICRCAFGVVTDMQDDVHNIYMRKAEEAVAINLDENPLIRLSYLMPWLIPLLNYVMIGLVLLKRCINKFTSSVEESGRFWLLNRLQFLVDQRVRYNEKPENKRIIDLLQLMLDTSTREPVQDYIDRDVLSKLLHHDEVIANIYLFLVAGYETTSTALGYSAYILAKEPLIQEKLQNEIDQTPDDDNQYDRVHSMTYLNWFIREVLRMYPIAPLAQTRECHATTNVCGHVIPEGCIIQPDVVSVHYNPDLWGPEDPNLFLPERHATTRHPMAFMPFGHGPRSCIGKQFALTEMKLCLARLLRHYSIRPGDQMEKNFELKDTLFILQPKAVNVKLERRS